MKEADVSLIRQTRPRSLPSLRDWVAVGFRQGRLIVFTLLAVFACVVLVTWMMPAQYQSEAKILVKRERADSVMSPNNQVESQPELTEQDVNSEVELIKSRDLLRQVVVASELDARFGHIPVSEAVADLEKNLTVEPLKKTKLINITYQSSDPELSASVLQTLIDLYLQKHLEVHRLPGAADFFKTQAEQYHKGLTAAQQRMADFGKAGGTVSAELEKEITVRKLNDFDAELRQSRAAVAETEKRIASLERQLTTTPSRLTTAIRTTDNAVLLQQMKSTLLTLELKRTELLGKFAPDYPPVQEVDAQIAHAREALAKAEENPVREEVTDRDTTHEWLTGELARARAELSSLQARVAATSQIVEKYREQAQRMNHAGIQQQDLIRVAKTAEENFLLYSRKQEEARISDALDRSRILNVSVAEAPIEADTPSSPNWPLNLLLGALLAGFVSIGTALTADYLDRSFRTPAQVEAILGIPVLASLPLGPVAGSKAIPVAAAITRRQPLIEPEQTLDSAGIRLLKRSRINELSQYQNDLTGGQAR